MLPSSYVTPFLSLDKGPNIRITYASTMYRDLLVSHYHVVDNCFLTWGLSRSWELNNLLSTSCHCCTSKQWHEVERLVNLITTGWWTLLTSHVFFLLPHYILHRSSPGQILGFGGWQPIVRMIRIHMVKSKGLLSKSVFYFHFKKLDTSLTK